MLRLILKNGGAVLRIDDEPEPTDGEERLVPRYEGIDRPRLREPVDLSSFKVFEIEHPDFEKFIIQQRDSNKPVVLLGIEVVIAPPKPLPLPPVLVPTAPTPGSPEALKAQEELKAKLMENKAQREKSMGWIFRSRPKALPLP